MKRTRIVKSRGLGSYKEGPLAAVTTGAASRNTTGVSAAPGTLYVRAFVPSVRQMYEKNGVSIQKVWSWLYRLPSGSFDEVSPGYKKHQHFLCFSLIFVMVFDPMEQIIDFHRNSIKKSFEKIDRKVLFFLFFGCSLVDMHD